MCPLGQCPEVLGHAVQVVAVAGGDQRGIGREHCVIIAEQDAALAERHPVDARSPPLLRQPDMADGRELGLGGHHGAAVAVKVERTGHRAGGLRDRTEDRDLVGVGVDQVGERLLGELHLRHPGVPVHSLTVPRVEISPGRRPGGVGLRRLGAVVHRDRRGEQRDLPAPGGEIMGRIHAEEATISGALWLVPGPLGQLGLP